MMPMEYRYIYSPCFKEKPWSIPIDILIMILSVGILSLMVSINHQENMYHLQ